MFKKKHHVWTTAEVKSIGGKHGPFAEEIIDQKANKTEYEWEVGRSYWDTQLKNMQSVIRDVQINDLTSYSDWTFATGLGLVAKPNPTQTENASKYFEFIAKQKADSVPESRRTLAQPAQRHGMSGRYSGDPADPNGHQNYWER